MASSGCSPPLGARNTWWAVRTAPSSVSSSPLSVSGQGEYFVAPPPATGPHPALTGPNPLWPSPSPFLPSTLHQQEPLTLMLSLGTCGRWGFPPFPRFPRSVALSCQFDLVPLCLLPGQWWVSVGMDNLVSIYSMPSGNMQFQVPWRPGGGGEGCRQCLARSPSAKAHRDPLERTGTGRGKGE